MEKQDKLARIITLLKELVMQGDFYGKLTIVFEKSEPKLYRKEETKLL